MTGESPKPALKDLTEQIRIIHFTLVLVAFVLLATSLQEPRRKVERSISDARSIYTLASALDAGETQISEQVERLVGQFIAASAQGFQRGQELYLEITWPTGKQTVGLYGGPLSWAYLSDRKYAGEDDTENPAYNYIPFRVKSLADFISFWNHNLTDQVVVIPRIEARNIQRLVLWNAGTSPEIKAKSFRLLPLNVRPSSMLQLHAGREGEFLLLETWPGDPLSAPRRIRQELPHGTRVEESMIVPGVMIRVPLIKVSSANIQVLF